MLTSRASPVINQEETASQVSSSDLRRYATAMLLFALVVWAIAHGIQLIERITHYYCALPIWDYWRTAVNFDQYRQFHFAILWQQHNEHRIILPELIFAVDTLFLHGRQTLPIVLSCLFYLGTLFLVVASFWEDKRVNLLVRMLAVLLAAIIALWQGVATILATPFQTQWTILQFAVACALTFLAKAKQKENRGFLIASIIAAAAATYSSGNGLLLWLILGAAAYAIRIRRSWLILLIAAAVVFDGAYFIGYQFSKETRPFELIQHPFAFLCFTGAYLGMPFSEVTNVTKVPTLGICLGLLNLASVIAIGIAARRRRIFRIRSAVVLFGTYAFTLCTVVITAAGRMDLKDTIFRTATVSRYLSVPLITWAVTILIWFWFVGLNRRHAARVPVYASAVAILLLISFRHLQTWLDDDASYFANYQMAALAMQENIVDPSVVQRFFPDFQFVRVFSPVLRHNKLSIYYKSMARWLGSDISRYAFLDDRPVLGAATFTYPVTGGIEVAGWADMSNQRRDYKWVLLANESGKIVGLGEKLPAGFPRDMNAFAVPPSLGWVGFVNLRYPTKAISAYLIDSRRATMYRLRAAADAPTVQLGSADQAGAPIAGVAWSGEGSWDQGREPGPVKGAVPQGKVYSSWRASDRDTGEWHTSVFDTPTDSCVILPVLHGPRVEGLSVTLTDADSGRVLASMPMQDEMTDWNFWRIPVPAGSKHVEVNAYDLGAAWGEWVAVVDPERCR